MGDEWKQHLYFQAPLRKQNGTIRLLTIRPLKTVTAIPDVAPSTIQCVLRLADIVDTPKFVAVSHRREAKREDDEPRRSILVNGALVPVSDSIANLLESLQKDTEYVTIWIDELCANEDDVAEKSAQMAQIHQIFSAAWATLVWLGPGADGSDDAMDALTRVAESVPSWTSRTPLGSNLLKGIAGMPKSPDTTTGAATGPPDHKGPNLDKQLSSLRGPLKKLMERSYWSRLWSIQELASSAKCLIACGNKRIELDRFYTAVKALDGILNASTISRWLSSGDTPTTSDASPSRASLDTEPANFFKSPAMRMLSEREFYTAGRSWWKPQEQPLQSVFGRTFLTVTTPESQFEVSDPKDRVFALLGLSVDAGTLGLSVDYSKNLRQVYTETTAAFLQNDARALQLCRGDLPRDPDLPSWVVDWGNVSRPVSDGVPYDRYFIACGPADARYNRVDTKTAGAVSFRGAVVDVVKIIGDGPGGDAGHLEQCRPYLSSIKTFWGESMALTSSPYKESQTVEPLAKIPVGDAEMSPDKSGLMRRATKLTLERYQSTLEALSERGSEELKEEHSDNVSQDDKITEKPAAHDFSGVTEYQLAIGKMRNRKPFLTETGYVGLGPSDLEPGDTIAIPYASRVPLALRKQEGDAYRLVGEVYVYDIMDGEFMTVHRKETVLRIV